VGYRARSDPPLLANGFKSTRHHDRIVILKNDRGERSDAIHETMHRLPVTRCAYLGMPWFGGGFFAQRCGESAPERPGRVAFVAHAGVVQWQNISFPS
jgi:hypothetical protein